MDDKDRKKIVSLVGEGMKVSEVCSKHFHNKYTYYDVYWAAYGEGMRSAQGTQNMISRRLNQLANAKKAEREELVAELADLVWQQYQIIKGSADKLDRIRQVLDE